jgi:hypothetical protein
MRASAILLLQLCLKGVSIIRKKQRTIKKRAQKTGKKAVDRRLWVLAHITTVDRGTLTSGTLLDGQETSAVK